MSRRYVQKNDEKKNSVGEGLNSDLLWKHYHGSLM